MKVAAGVLSDGHGFAPVAAGWADFAVAKPAVTKARQDCFDANCGFGFQCYWHLALRLIVASYMPIVLPTNLS